MGDLCFPSTPEARLKRLVLAVSLVFAFGAMCSGGGGDDGGTKDGASADKGRDDGGDADDGDENEEKDKDKEVVIVPVPGDDGGEHWCCEFVEEKGGSKLYALVAGPAECNAKYAEKEGRWVEGPQCTPCCCKSPNDKADASKGDTYELTTPGTCAGTGVCLAADSKECEGQAKEPEPDAPKPSPNPRPSTGGGGGGGGNRGSKAKRPH